jgi:hypothetical protein
VGERKGTWILWEAVSSPVFQISFKDYYKKHYDINIRDMEQPLLLNRMKNRIRGQGVSMESLGEGAFLHKMRFSVNGYFAKLHQELVIFCVRFTG